MHGVDDDVVESNAMEKVQDAAWETPGTELEMLGMATRNLPLTTHLSEFLQRTILHRYRGTHAMGPRLCWSGKAICSHICRLKALVATPSQATLTVRTMRLLRQ